MVMVPSLALDGSFWRRMAQWGSSQGPEWFVRYSPPFIGVAIAAVAHDRRRAVRDNLRRVRGDRGFFRDAVDVARTFAGYASCLTEILGAGSARGRLPEAVIVGEHHLAGALAEGRGQGLIVVTAHTAGWEAVGPLLSRDHGRPVLIVEAPELDDGARAIQDGARRAHGLNVVHAGDDPLAALPLIRHLREGGVVALQVDRTPLRMRSRACSLFGRPGRIPEGPFRLAALTGAPIVPAFAARTGHRRYEVHIHAPLRVGRAASGVDLDAAAQTVADAMQSFVRAHPTQWFHFRDD